MNESGNSVVAFAAAETGIEWALYEAIDSTNYTSICSWNVGLSQYVCPVPLGGVLGSATYSVIAATQTELASCPATLLCITSTGIYNGTQRVIRVQQ